MIRPLVMALARLHRKLLARRLPLWRGRFVPKRLAGERVWLVWRARTARGVRHGYALWPGHDMSCANDNAGVSLR